MKTDRFFSRVKNILLPCLLCSAITGILTGALVYGFKTVSLWLIETARGAYVFVAAHPVYIPVLAGALVLLAAASCGLLTWCPAARGGGIPSAIGILRGILHFQWLKTLVATVTSAWISFLAGVPLGNEGPSVQIGTALGRGVTRAAGARRRAWDRYLMTSGASAGFAAATCAPIAGLFFALEEAHKRFSPMILMSSFASVLCASVTVRRLAALFGGSAVFIEMPDPLALGLHDLWLPVVIGLVAGLCSVLYSLTFRGIDRVWMDKLSRVPLFWKILAVFLLSGAAGLISHYAVGSGHFVMEEVFAGNLIWQQLLLVFVIKFALTLLASNTGVTGGLFIPILTVGTLLGGLLAALFGAWGLPSDYALTVVVLTTASFMSATMHTPITALLFSIEALAGLSNALYIGVGVFIAYVVMETLDVHALNDMVLAHRIAAQNRGRVRHMRRAAVTVQPGAFAADKTMRDIFLPDNCLVLSVTGRDKVSMANGGEKTIRAGDVLQLRYAAYDDDLGQTHQVLCDLFGDQPINSEIVPADGG